ncbi:MAG: hypothetical protein NVS2B9_09310 [Myxococcales bacterium]
MRKALHRIAIALLVAAIVFARWYGKVPPGGPPLPRSAPSAGPALPEERLGEAGPLSLALYLPAGDAYGFAVSHAATAMGVPLFVTRDLSAALRQPMVVISGELAADAIGADRQALLRRFVAQGGILVLDDLQARGSWDLAGIERATPSRARTSIQFDAASGDPGFAHLRAPESRTIQLGNPARKEAFQTSGMFPRAEDGARVLARFDDGAPALLVRALGRGRVYALGAAFSDLILRAQVNRDYEAQRSYDNHFEPGADVPQFLLRDWYLGLVPGAVALSPVPDGLTGALLLTHDVDFARSVDNMIPYAQAEADAGVAATYFIQTHYLRDYEDEAFWDERAIAAARRVVQLGGEIESHSVAHAYDFAGLRLGSDAEVARWYRPRVLWRGDDDKHGLSVGATLFGETRVSRQLLSIVEQPRGVEAFRSGYLHIHPQQWSTLRRSGYRFDSSYSSNDVLTAFPYAAMEDGSFARESGILELPVLLADSVDPLSSLIPQFKAVLDAEAELRGVCVVLIHTDEVSDKLRTELALVEHVRGRFWIGPLARFGRFWEARAAVRVHARLDASGEVIELESPQALEGLTLDLPAGARVLPSPGTALARTVGPGTQLVLPPLAAGARLTIRLAFPGPAAAAAQARGP